MLSSIYFLYNLISTVAELLSLSCIFSINPTYVPENYFSDKLVNKLRRHNAPDKYIQHIQITVQLAIRASRLHGGVEEQSLSLNLAGCLLASCALRKYILI